jgi:hypothetical protein
MATHGATDHRIRAYPRYFHEASDYEWDGRSQRVEVRRDLSYDAFVREFVRPKRPVVIKDGVRSDLLTPAVFRSRFGETPLRSLVSGGGGSVLVRGRDSAIERFQSLQTIGDYMTAFEEGVDLPYLTNLCLESNFPALYAELRTPPYFQPNWRTRWPLSAIGFERKDRLAGEVFIGPSGSSYGVLHYDRHGVYLGICQYYGKKLWWLCPPEDSANLYPDTAHYPHLSPVDPFNPDLDRFPRFANVRPFVVTLEPGDIMFVPGFWWHLTNAVTANISSLVRFVNRHNVLPHVWDMKYYCRHEPRVALHTLKRMITNT